MGNEEPCPSQHLTIHSQGSSTMSYTAKNSIEASDYILHTGDSHQVVHSYTLRTLVSGSYPTVPFPHSTTEPSLLYYEWGS